MSKPVNLVFLAENLNKRLAPKFEKHAPSEESLTFETDGDIVVSLDCPLGQAFINRLGKEDENTVDYVSDYMANKIYENFQKLNIQFPVLFSHATYTTEPEFNPPVIFASAKLVVLTEFMRKQ